MYTNTTKKDKHLFLREEWHVIKPGEQLDCSEEIATRNGLELYAAPEPEQVKVVVPAPKTMSPKKK